MNAALDGVSPRLGLGTAAFRPGRRDAALHILDDWAALGGRLIDTAAVYGGGESERAIGEWLRASGHRRDVVLVTKGAHPDPEWQSRLDPVSIAADLAQSLDRLGTDVVDIYMVHRDDTAVPVSELMDALHEHVARGAVRSLGASNWTPERVDEANAYAAAYGRPGFEIVSNYFGLAEHVRRFLPGAISATSGPMRTWHAETGMPLLAWSAQSNGYFADDFDLAAVGRDVAETYESADNRARRERARELARRRGSSATQIALAWVLDQPFAPYALVGARSAAALRDAWAASDLALSAQELSWLETGRP